MKRVYQVGKVLWLMVVLAMMGWIYYAADKIVGSHWFAAGLVVIFAMFAFGAGAPGTTWFGSRPKFRHVGHRIIKSSWWGINILAMALMLFGTCSVFFVFGAIERDQPEDFEAVSLYRPLLASRVYARDGQVIGEFFLEKRYVVDLSRVPRHVQLAFVAAEDKRFYSHHGIDLIGIARAAETNLKAGRIKQGGSTITQQIAKLLITGNEKSFTRKIKEAILARKIEKKLSKDRILAIYLNHAYLGHGAYGIAAAAEVYFGKSPEDLGLAEAALIAGTPKAPGANSPFGNWKRAKERQAYVLHEMVDAGFVGAAEAAAAKSEPITIIAEKDDWNWVIAPYFVEHVRKYVYHKYGKEELFGKGLQIHTTLDLRMQLAAERAVKNGLEELSRRLGFSGPAGKIPSEAQSEFLRFPRVYPEIAGVEQMPAEIFLGQPYRGMVTATRGNKITVAVGERSFELDRTDIERVRRWTARDRNRRLETGDVIPVRVEERETGWGRRKKKIQVAVLVEAPTVQSALVALDPATGEVRAMQGGYDYHMTQFNRATQAKRQAGSSIKPFVYTPSVDELNKTEVDIVLDGPISVPTAGGYWSPHNYKGEFAGPVTLRTALAKSYNTVSVRLALEVGVPRVIDYMRKMGLEKSVIPRHISISLGTPDVIPLEMTAAFASFPAGGKRVRPVFITKIKSHDGTVLEENHSGVGEQVMSPETAYIMVDMMKGVVTNGTGKKASELGRPVGGKTGTSNDFRDAWFIGYTTELVTGVWVGRDNFKPIGADTTGGNTAAPIWLDFMKSAHPPTPPRDFAVPPGIVFVRMNGTSGQRARLGEWGSVLIPFKQGTVPQRLFKGVDDRFSEEEVPSTQPVESASQPASNPASAPVNQPANIPASQPASIPSSAPAPADMLPGGVEEPDSQLK